jgi:hypothetical protein
VLLVRDMREKRKSNSIQQRASGAAKRIAWKRKGLRERYGTTKQQKTTPPNRKRQLLQNHNDNRQKRDRDREQASKH